MLSTSAHYGGVLSRIQHQHEFGEVLSSGNGTESPLLVSMARIDLSLLKFGLVAGQVRIDTWKVYLNERPCTVGPFKFAIQIRLKLGDRYPFILAGIRVSLRGHQGIVMAHNGIAVEQSPETEHC